MGISKEERKKKLLEKAEKDYPIGTKYKGIYYGNVVIRKGDFNYYDTSNKPRGGIMITDGYGDSVYYKGKWGEIITENKNMTKDKKLEEELIELAKENYPIGTVYEGCTGSVGTSVVEPHIMYLDNEIYGIEVGIDYIYLHRDEKWAKILSKPVEIKSNRDASEEELLDIARRNYPPGTIYNGFRSRKKYTVTDDLVIRNGCIYNGNNPGCIYHGGSKVWSKIIDRPDLEVVKRKTVGIN